MNQLMALSAILASSPQLMKLPQGQLHLRADIPNIVSLPPTFAKDCSQQLTLLEKIFSQAGRISMLPDTKSGAEREMLLLRR